MKHAIHHLPRPRGTDREHEPETRTFELWGARYELPDVEPALDAELRELRGAIAELRERLADLEARERTREVTS